MKRVYNFSAGPSMLPEAVLKRAAAEMLDHDGSGQSVMEMSHRSKEFEKIIENTESLLRQVMDIPDNYRVLFMQGGATAQFAAVPMNLMTENRKADYALSGQFSKKAFQEGRRYGDCKAAATSEDENFSRVPEIDPKELRHDADYFHFCLNNTVYGTTWHKLPDVGSVPLVADISSCILSGPLDVSRFGLLYAGAQKNAGPAGLTLVILREDLIREPLECTPSILSYRAMAEHGSMVNTPPCWSIYICGLVLEWLRDEIGGLTEMEQWNQKKAGVLYNFLDSSSLFTGCAQKESRSMMNVTFTTGRKDLDERFIQECKDAGLVNLKGHRSVGGMRASLYNAMPLEGTERLVGLMEKFQRENG